MNVIPYRLEVGETPRSTLDDEETPPESPTATYHVEMNSFNNKPVNYKY